MSLRRVAALAATVGVGVGAAFGVAACGDDERGDVEIERPGTGTAGTATTGTGTSSAPVTDETTPTTPGATETAATETP